MIAALLLAAAPCQAEPLDRHEQFICAAQQVTVCTADGVCDRAPSADLQIPLFLLVDLAGKRLSTTQASGENRETAVSHLERQGDLIVLQGSQGGRAFSFMISERTGFASIAIAMDGAALSVFAACTPNPAR
ncbi:MAG: hypothetical protein KF911_01710 [Pseudomonadales bacterium]|nr:hypothetical protein [Pseudomonadales bacterium]